MNNVVFNIHRGIYFLGFLDTEFINKKHLLYFDNEGHPIGTVFSKIGTNPRTTLDLGYSIKYSGFYEGHVLFEPIVEEVTEDQLSLFPSKKYQWFIAPLYIDNQCLLMPSSTNGFWDIKP